MISFLLFIAIVWMLNLIYAFRVIFIPSILDRIDEARWVRLHPGLPSYRRVK